MEAYGRLVGPPVFNTGEGSIRPLAGSIPVRLRHHWQNSRFESASASVLPCAGPVSSPRLSTGHSVLTYEPISRMST